MTLVIHHYVTWLYVIMDEFATVHVGERPAHFDQESGDLLPVRIFCGMKDIASFHVFHREKIVFAARQRFKVISRRDIGVLEQGQCAKLGLEPVDKFGLNIFVTDALERNLAVWVKGISNSVDYSHASLSQFFQDFVSIDNGRAQYQFFLGCF